MEGVSEIDAHFGKLFLKLWDVFGKQDKQHLIEYLKKKLSNRAIGTEKLNESLPADPDEFRSYMEINLVSKHFDTYMRWKVIKKAFNLLDFNNPEVEIFDRLFTKVGESDPLCTMRNNYGHKTREELEKTHNEGICKYVREELRAQLKNMNDLLSENDGK